MSVNSYATVDEIRRRYPGIIETSNLTPLEIDAHISDAEGEVNGRLARRYTIPFAPGMEPIRTLTRDLASYSLLRSLIIQEDPSRSDWVESIRDRADKLLDALVEGKAAVVTTSGAVVGQLSTVPGGVWSSTMGYAPTMSILDSIQQEVDPDRVQDEEDKLD